MSNRTFDRASLRSSATLLLAGELLYCLLSSNSSSADWPKDPRANLSVCSASGDQGRPVAVTDGAGGAFVVWIDRRRTDWDIYAQHVLPTGVIDSAWPPNGLAVCSRQGDQVAAQLVAGTSGDVIISWIDERGHDRALYAQRVLPTGAFAPGWPTEGLAICAGTGDRVDFSLVPDRSGGAVVVWLEARGDSSKRDVLAQHVLASGTLESSASPAENTGIRFTELSSSDDPTTLQATPDGAGGAIVAWDHRRGDHCSVSAVRVLASGVLDPVWPTNGLLLRVAPGGQRRPAIVSDGAGGAIVAWDERSEAREGIYIQHVRSDGTMDPQWPKDGRAATPSNRSGYRASLAADGAGGAFVTWAGSSHAVQHVLSNGSLAPNWPEQGVPLSDYFGDHDHRLVTDGSGGVIVAWCQALDGFHFGLHGRSMTHEGDVLAQHVLAAGNIDPAWPKHGQRMSNAKGEQTCPSAIADGAGGMIVFWEDWRSGLLVNGDYIGDIYAQRVGSDGKLGGTVVSRP